MSETIARAGVLGLGYLASVFEGDWSAVVVRVVGRFVGSRPSYRVCVAGLDVSGGVAGDRVFWLSDQAGKVKAFSDIGAALVKLRAVLEPAGDRLLIDLVFEDVPGVNVPSNMGEWFGKRMGALGVMRGKQGSLSASYVAAINAAGDPAAGGFEFEMKDEMVLRNNCLLLDIAEMERQGSAYPSVTFRPIS